MIYNVFGGTLNPTLLANYFRGVQLQYKNVEVECQLQLSLTHLMF